MKTNKSIIAFLLIMAIAIAGTTFAQQGSGDGDGVGDHVQTQESGGNPAMFRKNVSKTEEEASAKAKLNVMGVWFPALHASSGGSDGVAVPATYLDETGAELPGIAYYDQEGFFIRSETQAKPLVVVYADEIGGSGFHDVFAAISRDDGTTWKRKNLSRMADKSSFTLANGEEYYGHSKKPVFQVKGNKILVVWSSKFAKGGRPRYAIKIDDNEDDPKYYPHDDIYYEEDIWGISGHQGSHDYTEDGFEQVGEVPYSAVWSARGIIATQADVNNGLGKFPGDIVWFKPERLTSARRDAYQIFVGGADGAGFATTWQEDPEGIRPGKGVGPGHGWSGATTNHKTDVWYSFITWADFAKVDENFVAGGDPEHDDPDFVGRPKALVPMSLPVRISDNDVVNTENLQVELNEDGFPKEDGDGNWIPIIDEETGKLKGSHGYGYEIDGLCDSFYDFTNMQDAGKQICVTEDGRILDGDTSASRPNLFLQTYTKPDGSKSAWAIMAYEETKGVGGGPPDDTGTGGQPEDGTGSGNEEYKSDEGKVAIYHSFDFQNPDLVSAGNILNLPATDENGDPLYLLDEEGNQILHPLTDEPMLAYENARRPRFILQGKGAIGDSGTTLIVVYKQGEDGMGRPSDIMLRRNEVTGGGNPYAFKWFVDGAQNMSSVSAVETWINPDRDENAKGDGVKVVKWAQTVENLDDKSWMNPYDDARAHRGQLRGDFVVMGYSWTPNWAATRNYNDKYNFYIRRSFDGGQTWTTDPDGTAAVMHTEIFMDPDEPENADKHYEEVTEYAPNTFEPARNVSLLRNNKETVIEPRIVAVPGTIKTGGKWTGIDEDKQNRNVFYLSYGLAANDDSGAPTDLYWSFSKDKGQTLKEVEHVINPDSSSPDAGETVWIWDWLAKKKDEEEGEAQLRMTPSGERFYACWLQEGEEGSDITFRRIMDMAFEDNVSLAIDGYTVDIEDGTAVSGVAVQLLLVDETDADVAPDTTELTLYAETVSDEEGYFKFETLPEATYVVAVEEELLGLVFVNGEDVEDSSALVAVNFEDNPHTRVMFMARHGVNNWFSITKEQSFFDRNGGVFTGDTISYAISVDVASLFQQSIDLVISDTLSEYVTYLSGTDGVSYDDDLHLLTYESSLDLDTCGDSTLTLGFDVMVNTDVELSTMIVNTATVSAYREIGQGQGPGAFTGALVLTKDSNTTQVEVVPEPATIVFIGVGLFGIAVLARRKRNRNQ